MNRFGITRFLSPGEAPAFELALQNSHFEWNDEKARWCQIDGIAVANIHDHDGMVWMCAYLDEGMINGRYTVRVITCWSDPLAAARELPAKLLDAYRGRTVDLARAADTV